MATVEDILKKLKTRSKPENVEGMAKYGMVADQQMGVSVPDMRKIAKEVGKDHTRNRQAGTPSRGRRTIPSDHGRG